jgi:AcrR family transcriptional regulator
VPDGAASYRRKTAEARKGELVQAAIDCLAQHGVAGFTVENICAIAGVSRGLISHHFGGKDALLAAAYAAMTAHIERLDARAALDAGTSARGILKTIVDNNFSSSALKRSEVKAWLAIYGEIAGNPRLLEIHRRRYERYHASLVTAIEAAGRETGASPDAAQLATSLIALIDGLWLQWGLDATRVSPEDAKRACYDLLGEIIGEV